jgi:hypothetical protein
MDEALKIPGLRPEGCSTGLVRRLKAGELAEGEAAKVQAHVKTCERCAALFAELERDAAAFVRQVPFDHFAAKTTHRRESLRHARARRRRFVATMALAAALLVVVVAGPLRYLLARGPQGHNLRKGGGLMELYVGGNGEKPRVAQDREALVPGERVRVGYEAADRRYVAVLSVDESGRVTPLYPESGMSLHAELTPGVHILPDSVEFTGAGYERVITLFTDEPASVETIAAAAKKAFERTGSVEAMGSLELPGEQSSKLVRKR